MTMISDLHGRHETKRLAGVVRAKAEALRETFFSKIPSDDIETDDGASRVKNLAGFVKDLSSCLDRRTQFSLWLIREDKVVGEILISVLTVDGIDSIKSHEDWKTAEELSA
jgi:hypothetical protein